MKVLKFFIVCFFLNSCGIEGVNIERWAVLPVKIQIDDDRDLAVVEFINSKFSDDVLSPGESGDIEIQIVEKVSNPLALAETYTKFNSEGIVSALIEIEESAFVSDEDQWYFLVLIHELGHAFGAPHMDTGIMREKVPHGTKNIDEKVEPLIDWIVENYDVERAQ